MDFEIKQYGIFIYFDFFLKKTITASALVIEEI